MPSTWSGADRDRRPVEPGREVADHPPVAALVGVGTHVHQGAHLAAGPLEQPGRDQRLDQARQRGLGAVGVDRRLQRPQPDQRLQR